MEDKFTDDVIFVKERFGGILKDNFTLGCNYTIQINYVADKRYLIVDNDGDSVIYPKYCFLSTKEAIRETLSKELC